MIKKFSAYVEEQAPAQDYVPSKSEGPAKGEKDFVNQHTATKTDYIIPGQDHVFNGDIKEEVEVEDDEESDLSEGTVWDALQNIVKTKGAKKVKFANGKSVTVDMTTANAMVQLHKKLNDKNKEKMIDQIEKSPEVLIKLMGVAFGK